ncbi:ATP-dependent exoDNAse (exonuclease V) beta subunit (contains helicase and exonuclease domains) [Zunongwangia mangrovi]|uniref:DNA 3'-5' helicase n=1 Tax=Zunongwangia mangrovi TaxID=1334022 RepID=A0A1I1DHM8_9FLAO|nr:UvrD-helicase domain-containing protein [Zunongwangia mangrovi]SFB74421.1 ATP-dependent exoDNAse (exonuclease V) beta subunit (contains helicase and exonuclease domains) [Zunongwangia mangrovi]
MANNFTIYNASAGSGKTFTLVKSYLSLLFRSGKTDSYKNILAITFTNKAVAEMKTRIVESLYAFTKNPVPESSKALLEAVANETEHSTEEIQQKSVAILKNIIHNYAAFEVSTIDGFTHRVLRTFAKDLGLPVNFEVELDTDKILNEAVDRLINRTGNDEKLTKVLVDFSLSKADEDKSWDIGRDLLEIAKLLVNENNQFYLKQLQPKTLEDFETFSKKLKQQIKNNQAKIGQKSDQFFELIADSGIDPTDFSGQYLPKHFLKLKANETPNFTSKWVEKLENEGILPLKKGKMALGDAILPQILDLFVQTKKLFFSLEFYTEIGKRLTQLSLLNALNREIQEIKEERQILLISEFNPMISAQVKDQPAPFIYERLGERYQNYFIDEFQDTSQMQWKNLIPLIDNKLSMESLPDETSSLMLVGDAKQSIYRWRGGKAEQFIDLSNEGNPFQIEKQVFNLPDNYRSAAEIVNFNNQFFGYAADFLGHPEYSKLFKQSAQNPKKSVSGYVNIGFIEAENREEEQEVYPEKVIEIINNLDAKGFKRSDICILTRRKSEGVAIASALNEKEIDVVSSETLLISRSPEVHFICDLLKFSITPENNELKLSVFGFLQEYLLRLEDPHSVISAKISENGTDFFSWLQDYEFDFNLDFLNEYSVYESCEYIIRSFGLVKDSNAYIQFFLDFVYETTQKDTEGIQGFLEIWEQENEKLSIIAPQQENAVTIMTIHKAKGLEFPIVIYPFANSDFKDTRKDSLWVPNDGNLNDIPVSYINASSKMENWGEIPDALYTQLLFQNELDTLNVLYVACTRPVKQLYILSKLDLDRSGNEYPNKTSGLLIGYLKRSGIWNDEQLNYEFGEIDAPTSEEKENSGITLQHFYSSATQNQAVNIVTRSGSLWDTKQQEAIEKGEIIHDLLAEINTEKDLKPVLKNAIANGVIAEEVSDKIETLLQNIISHPELEIYFSEAVKNDNERDIITENGERLRPDRLNFDGQLVSVIDYKTGAFDAKHEHQINNYGETLTKMGFHVDKKILVYTNKAISLRFV